MNYSIMSEMYRHKFSKATIYQCEYAIRDIDDTLKLHRDKDTSHPYVAKLFCERDAALDRKFFLKSKLGV